MPFSRGRWVHDVFLSFRGEDTRSNFVSHLCSALRNAGIDTFIDDELPRGERISDGLKNAIRGSNCALVVLSENYAASKWCVAELAEIMQCRSLEGQIVIPIFFGVNPSHVRKGMGPYAEALKRHQLEDLQDNYYKAERWKEAFREVANLSGWDSKAFRNESKFIRRIVEDVITKLGRTLLHIADYPVGIESHVQEVISQLLSRQSKDVCMVGIWGMGGIGKTTIAKAIYNTIACNFHVRSFLANIRELWKQYNGQVCLQEQLILSIIGEQKKKILDIEWRENLMNRRLRSRKALVVLDDVDKLPQLRALCNRDWFGPGSIIIITTRDERLLKVHQVDHIYPMSEMEKNESLELFSWHAFKEASPAEDVIELSRKVVSYCRGLPLALEILGSYLFGREIPEWNSVLSKLERIPNDQIQEKLRISFDGLNDDKIKDIFLDISCFFIGMDREYVTQILNGCELYAESGITVLLERSLLKVDMCNKLGMHDLLRDMGREIIREKFPNEPEKRSRLWFHKDIHDVLTEHIGTRAIEGMASKLPRINREVLSTEAFKEMKRLRLLQLDHVQLDGDYKHLSKCLRWLRWHGFPLRYLPDNFDQNSLVAIDLKHSNLKLVWKKPQLLESLKILNLSHSCNLIHTPDFTKLPNLEKLVLKHCPSLVTVHKSIGKLKNLLLVDLKDCKRLKDLPRSIYQLKSLKTLILSGCSLIDKLEEDIEQMESLTHLAADNTGIVQVPFALARSKSLGYISVCGYEGRARQVLPSIIWSWMSPSNIFQSLTQAIGSMSSLVSLALHGDGFHGLSQTVTSIPRLRHLWVKCDSNLQQTQDISSLNASAARNCVEYETAPNASLQSLMIQMGGCNNVVDTLVKKTQQIWNSGKSDHCFLPDDKYPDWFVYKGEGSSVTFKVPTDVGRILKGITLCIAYSFSLADPILQFLVSISIINHTKVTFQYHEQDSATSFEYEKWQRIVSDLEPGDEVEVIVNIGHKCTVKEITAYLIYGDSDDLAKLSKRCIDTPDTIYTKEGKKKRKL